MAAERILLCDDTTDIVEILASALRSTGYEVVTAGSGEEALHLAASRPPDLAIVDLRLPGMDGLELTRGLKDAARGRFLPVILLTVMDELPDRLRGFEAGCDDYLGKPVS